MSRRGLTALVAASVGLSVVATSVAFARSAVRRTRSAAAELNETLPVNSAWWRAKAQADGELLYVALGDSAAQGIGASRPEFGYVGILGDRIAARSGCSVRTVNLAVSGATVAQAVDYQVPRLEARRPDVVTVSIGANDITSWDATAFETALGTVFDALPPHAIVADLPCFYLPHNERLVAEANRVVRRLAAARGLVVAPLHETTRRPGLFGVLTMFAGDRFHPNDRGYRVWASAFAPLVDARVDQLVAERPATPTSEP
ncbi:SGNH/GDSL hydrolase family protein [Planctomonas sp. JC2975]|uniref:SGNH/GDSL hydrolase family protein n=1 Tax=Planctomonas sp. JC2975 TaxID=2729626 RepID=UPI001475CD4D|nr:SGNH/GDSL hydrolase family protein [Planctomonas sp. JC2975]NNC12022.1 SGNH/GDSL hydrolase family protein [Planctomonas sp. JC2975]